MSTIGLQLKKQLGGVVAPNANVLFDTTVNILGPVSYNSGTGVVTINKTGRYFINWWVATQSSIGATGIGFSIVTSQGDDFLGNSP